jgi:hypothetical protein
MYICKGKSALMVCSLVVYEVLEQVVSGSRVLLCSCLYVTPLAWIHDLSKQQVEELASQLGLRADGTLDNLGRRVKESGPQLRRICLPSRVRLSFPVLKFPVP